jgi:hypothetical protein
MNSACPTCGRKMVPGQAENRFVGHFRFCTNVCLFLWYEDPNHDRRREARDVLVDRRVQALVS